MYSSYDPLPITGRGANRNIDHRFSRLSIDIKAGEVEQCESPTTQVSLVRARSIVTRNNSPDVGFNLSVNPYQGCEHGCVYCFARPTHAYHDLSPGLDFETRIMAKVNAVELLREALSRSAYRCEPIAIGVNTDAYQPVERKLAITRGILQTCLEFRQPVVMITKSKLILRDLDILEALSVRSLVRISVSVTTLDDDLKRRLEPRTAGPAARLKAIETLARAGVPVGAMVAPVIPRINDHEMEKILAEVSARGASSASYVLLRLPHEVEPLFIQWLRSHFPEREAAVMNAVRSCRGGKTYDSRYHQRMTGVGLIAEMIARRFDVARRRTGLDREKSSLSTSQFRIPGDRQQPLFS